MNDEASGLSSGKGPKNENFPVAGLLLKPLHRAPIMAFYRFARAGDDIADNASASPEEKLGLAAAIIGARNSDVRGVATISAVDLGGFAAQGKEAIAGFMSANMDGLSGTSPAQLADEIFANRGAWALVGQARGLHGRPVLVLTADDGLADAGVAFGKAVSAQGGTVTDVHLATDHAYSGQRIALQTALLGWIEPLR